MSAVEEKGQPQPQQRKLPLKLGNYLLVYRLAAGGMGEVYLAFQQSSLSNSKRVVALKVEREADAEDDPTREMFLSEARASANLQHQNIVHVYEVGVVDDVPFIAMEYIEGSSIGHIRRAMKSKGGPVPPHIGAAIFLEAARALQYTHDVGLVHRDVSPPNILVSDQGHIKLIDFGVAKAESIQHTVPGVLKGKYAYMAPEYLQGQNAAPACDVYALGIVMHEVLTGKRVFSGASAGAIISSVLQNEILRPSTIVRDLPPDLDNLVHACCARDPALRPSADKVAERLEALLPSISPAGAGASSRLLGKWHEEVMAQAISARKKLRQDLMALDIAAVESAAAPFSTGIDVDVGADLNNRGRVVLGSVSGTRTMSTTSTSGSSPHSSTGMAALQPLGGPKQMRLLAIAMALLGLTIVVTAVLVFLVMKKDEPLPPAPVATAPQIEGRPQQPSSEATERRTNGMQAMAAHDYERAVREFEGAIKLGATDPDIGQLLALAMTLRSQPKPPEPRRPEGKAAAPVPRAQPPVTWRPAPAPKPAREAPVEKAAPPEVVEEKGTIFVTSSPPGLTCEIDGRVVGVTPHQQSVSTGTHAVRILKDGVLVQSSSHYVSNNGTISVYAEWKPPVATAAPAIVTPQAVAPATPAPAPATAAKDYGELVVQSPNVFGQVFVGGVDHGTAPVVVKNVPIGPATVEIRVGGTVRRSRVVDVTKGQRKTVFFE